MRVDTKTVYKRRCVYDLDVMKSAGLIQFKINALKPQALDRRFEDDSMPLRMGQ